MNWNATSRALPVPWHRGILHTGPDRLRINLPTTRPLKNQSLSLSATIALGSTDPVEFSLWLEAPYEREQNVGRILLEVQVGVHVFSEDIALTAEPVHLRYQTVGQQSVPVSFQLIVVRNCAESKAWPRATTATLRLLDCLALPAVKAPSMYASRGIVQSTSTGSTAPSSALLRIA